MHSDRYANDAMLGPIFERIRHLLPSAVEGRRLYGRLSHRVHMYKYEGGDEFKRHVDGQGPAGQSVEPDGNVRQWAGQKSQYTALFYLTDGGDGVVGGATRLFAMDRSGEYVDVEPRKGSILYFRHGPGESVLHQGLPVGGGAPKYIIRASLLYEN
jgi:hypothetical protein